MTTANCFHAGFLAATAALVTLLAAPALAQDQQEQDPGVDIPTGLVGPLTPYNGLDEAYREPPPRGDARFYDPSLGFDLPTRAEQFAIARQDLQISRELVRQTRAELRFTEREEREMLERSPEYREARRAFEQARQALNEARAEARLQAQEDERYQSAAERLEEIEQMIRQAHRQPGTTRTELLELAEQRLWYSQRLSELRDELTDPEPIEQARTDVQDAADRLEEVELAIDRELREIPEVAEARDRHQQARAFHDSARRDFVGARAAYFEADFRQVQQDRIRRLRPVQDPYVRWGW